jgi:tRNA pseudouridine38-40 synthase
MKIALIVEYEGTRYHGFQIQTSEPTIQGELERVLMVVTGEEIRISYAGRTDQGVHAKGQVQERCFE